MIKKLPFETKQTEYEGKIFTTETHTNPYDMQVKINELVDAVNGILDYAPLEMAMKVEPAENTTISKMENVAKNAQDPYAEQRKWIGKLCRFWIFKDGAVDIGILKAVDNLNPTLPYINDLDCSYAYCEPVKPNDDIIYQKD